MWQFKFKEILLVTNNRYQSTEYVYEDLPDNYTANGSNFPRLEA